MNLDDWKALSTEMRDVELKEKYCTSVAKMICEHAKGAYVDVENPADNNIIYLLAFLMLQYVTMLKMIESSDAFRMAERTCELERTHLVALTLAEEMCKTLNFTVESKDD